MSRLWIVLWAIAMMQIGAWTFASPPRRPPPATTHPTDNPDERYLIEGRNKLRKEALRVLDLTWSSRCTALGGRAFHEGLAYYYAGRQAEMEYFPRFFRREVAEYIMQRWTGADDMRIERMTREAYRDGYLQLAELQRPARTLAEATVAGEHVTGKGCNP